VRPRTMRSPCSAPPPKTSTLSYPARESSFPSTQPRSTISCANLTYLSLLSFHAHVTAMPERSVFAHSSMYEYVQAHKPGM